MEKRRKLNVELIKFLIGSMLVVGVLMLLGSSLVNNRQYRKFYNDKALEIAKTVSDQVNGDFIEELCKEIDTEEFEQMADKMLALYDAELLEANPRDQYLMDLNSAISDFRKQDYSITTFTPSQSTDVEESVVKGRECAKLYCTYTIKSGASYSTSLEVFELRKDQAGHWKILGFQLASSVE